MKSWRCHSLPTYRNPGVLCQLFSSCTSKNSVSGIFHLQKASVPSELKIVFRWYLLKYCPSSTCLGRFLIHHDHQHFWLPKPTLKSLTLFQDMHRCLQSGLSQSIFTLTLCIFLLLCTSSCGSYGLCLGSHKHSWAFVQREQRCWSQPLLISCWIRSCLVLCRLPRLARLQAFTTLCK